MAAPGAICMFLLAGGLALPATWVVRRLARRLGIVNHPNAIVPQHTQATAYLGGAGIFVGLLAAVLIGPAVCGWIQVRLPEPSTVNWPVVGFAAGFLILGLIDDLTGMSAKWKLLLQVILAATAAALGIQRSLTGVAPLDAALSAFWILLLVNAFNVTDVCDGLVGGIALVTFVFLGFYDGSAPLAFAAAGACAGFLWFNAPPASIFLGDAGSHLLGFLAAALTLSMRAAQPAWPHVAQMALVLGVPLFEVAFLVVVRRRKGLAWWKGSPDHFSLRLQAAGLSKLRTDLIAWIACAGLCAAAVGVGIVGGWGQAILLAAVFVVLAGCWRALLNWDVAPKPAPAES